MANLSASAETALAMKHSSNWIANPMWTASEQAIMDEVLKNSSASESLMMRCARIALKLPDKTARDVAMRLKWMNKNVSDRVPENDAPTTMIMENVNDVSCKGVLAAIRDPIDELFEQNTQLLRQISANRAANQFEESTKLFCQLRDNINKTADSLNNMPEMMVQMPPCPFVIDGVTGFYNYNYNWPAWPDATLMN